MFKYPSTNFNEVNLNWIMQTIKEMEPAVGMISDAEAALEQANTVAAQAAQSAADANAAVSSVTTLASQADAKADQAIQIATQAASATIADDSVTEPKLSTELRTKINDADSNASMAVTSASNANGIANAAAQTAGAAQLAAASAASAAQTADTKAQTALDQIAALDFGNWVRYANIGGSGSSLPHEVDTPVAKEYLIVLYSMSAGNRRQSMVIPYTALELGTNYYWAEISGIVCAVKADTSKFLFDDASPLGAAVIYIR